MFTNDAGRKMRLKYFEQTALAILVTLICGCGWLHNRNPPAGQLSANLGQYTCLNESGQKVTGYLNGSLNADGVREFTGCVRTALRRFMMYTSDSVEGGYRPEDLQHFLNSHYLSKTQQLSDQFVKDIMDLKVVILGGRRTVITDDEINKMIDLVTVVQNYAIDNLPYIHLYDHLNDNEDPTIDRALLEQAKAHLQSAALDFASRLQANGVSYRLDSMERLIGDVQDFFNWRALHPDSLSPEVFTKLVQAHKYVVTGQLSNEINPNDWPVIFDSITGIISAVVNYRAIDQGALTYGPHLDVLIATARDIFDLIGRTIDRLPNKVITFDSTDRLFQALGDAHFLGALRVQSVDKVYRYAIAKAFRDPLAQSKSAVVTGLTWSQLGQIENEFNIWADSQSYLSDRAAQSLGFTASMLPNAFKSFESELKNFDMGKLMFNYGDPRGQELEKIIDNIPPYFRDQGRRAYIMPRDDLEYYGVKYGVTDLTYMNMIHTLARLLVRGFASNSRIAKLNGDWTKTGVTESEMGLFYNTVHDLGEDLKFMYPKYGSGSKSFIEGKLFTYAGDGISWPGDHSHDLLNFDQIMEYITELWSGGQVRNQIYDDLRDKCSQPGYPKDVFGFSKLSRACFTDHFFDNDLNEFDNLPGLKLDFIQMSLEQKREIMFNLEAIARIPCTDGRYIEFSEIATIATVFHYVETIFTVYDQNRDGALDQYEIMNAFNRFHGYLARQVQASMKTMPTLWGLKVLNLNTDTLESIFAFLIEKQRAPKAAIDLPPLYWDRFWYFNPTVQSARSGIRDVLQKVIFWRQFNDRPYLPRMSIDRAGVLNILRVLAQSSTTPYTCH